MKTIDLTRTIRWLGEQMGQTTKNELFSGKLFHGIAEKEEKTFETLLRISSEMAVTQRAILAHPFAIKVLAAFKIEQLFDSGYIIPTLSNLFKAGPARDPGELWAVIRRWHNMEECAKPIEELTVPNEIIHETDFDETLTIQIIRPDGEAASLETLRDVVGLIDDLYSIFANLNSESSVQSLQIIYVASGSSIRIDVKGLGEPIKQIKNLLVEGWSLWRHRKSTELTENSRALLSSLKTLGEIEKKVKDGSIKRHDADALKARVQKTMLGLFAEGALPREVPTVESVSNATLIEVNSQKLLNAPSAEDHHFVEQIEAPVTIEEVSPPNGPKEKPKRVPKRSKK